jgi:hypothetical protein
MATLVNGGTKEKCHNQFARAFEFPFLPVQHKGIFAIDV